MERGEEIDGEGSAIKLKQGGERQRDIQWREEKRHRAFLSA